MIKIITCFVSTTSFLQESLRKAFLFSKITGLWLLAFCLDAFCLALHVINILLLLFTSEIATSSLTINSWPYSVEASCRLYPKALDGHWALLALASLTVDSNRSLLLKDGYNRTSLLLVSTFQFCNQVDAIISSAHWFSMSFQVCNGANTTTFDRLTSKNIRLVWNWNISSYVHRLGSCLLRLIRS